MTAGSDADLNGDAEARSRLIAANTQVTARAPQLAPLVFTPAAVPHPMADAVEAFHHAAGQLLRRDNEHPLAFFGVHSMNRVTHSREAVGFLTAGELRARVDELGLADVVNTRMRPSIASTS